MGGSLSISICNERGPRALPRAFRKPGFTGGVSASGRPDPRNRSHPRVVGTPALTPVFVQRGSDPSSLPPFALRAESIGSSRREAERFHPEAVERTRPCPPIDEPAHHLPMARPQGFCVPETRGSCSATFDLRSTPLHCSAQEKNRPINEFFNPQIDPICSHNIHNRPQIATSHSPTTSETRFDRLVTDANLWIVLRLIFGHFIRLFMRVYFLTVS